MTENPEKKLGQTPKQSEEQQQKNPQNIFEERSFSGQQ
jgi:hypothetical protein